MTFRPHASRPATTTEDRVTDTTADAIRDAIAEAVTLLRLVNEAIAALPREEAA